MRFLVVFVVLTACGDGNSNPDGGGMCTNAIYDPCTSNDQCTSMNCKLFMGDGFQVCTQTCTPGDACPMQGGTAITCNAMGVCKPPQANACTR